MAYPIHGKVARVDKGGTDMAHTTGWDITANVDMDEITAQGDDWKDFIAGCAEWDGKIDCLFDPSNTEQKALMDNIIAVTPGTKLTDVKFELEDSGDYFSGDLFVTSFPVTTSIGGKVTCSFSFKGSGALTLTIA